VPKDTTSALTISPGLKHEAIWTLSISAARTSSSLQSMHLIVVKDFELDLLKLHAVQESIQDAHANT